MACPTPKVVIIGGNSSIARHLLTLLPEAHSIARHAGGERTTAIGRYEDVGAAHFEGAEIVINCAGIVRGSQAELDAVNVKLQQRFAATARQAGIRRYVAISSFSIFGPRERIDNDSPIDPHDDYGVSKRDGDDALRGLHSSDFTTVSVAFPTIIGTTRAGKVERMLQWWRRSGFLPVPARDVHRSMIGSECAARVLVDAAMGHQSGRLLAADPVPFSYRQAANWLREDIGAGFRRIPVPEAMLPILRRISPGLYRSMMTNSLLDPRSNHTIIHGIETSLKTEILRAVRSGEGE